MHWKKDPMLRENGEEVNEREEEQTRKQRQNKTLRGKKKFRR